MNRLRSLPATRLWAASTSMTGLARSLSDQRQPPQPPPTAEDQPTSAAPAASVSQTRPLRGTQSEETSGRETTPTPSATQAADANLTTVARGEAAAPSAGSLASPEPEPVRWVQPAYEDPDTLPIVDEKGEYIVSRVQWPTGEIAYTPPPPTDDKLAPRFGYNVVQVKKHVSWWRYNQKYPRLSLAYINIQVLFLLGMAWLAAFLTTEHRRTTEAMKTPGAMVGEHRGRGPVTSKTQKITFSPDEMDAMVDKAQNNWLDGSAEANYIGSKDYRMKKIPRPKEFTVDDFRKR